MLKRRILSALFLVPIALAALWLGGWPYTALVSVFCLIASWEFVQMFSTQEMGLSRSTVFTQLLLWLAYGRWEHTWILTVGFPIVLLVSVGEHVLTYRRLRTPIEGWALSVAGGVYIGLGAAYLLRLRWTVQGQWWLLFALLVVWVADSAAYFVGRAWGEHKMAPLISPHKSWEGYVAGVLSGVLLGLVANFLLPFSLWRGVGLGALLALLTPLGDLFISLMKRQMGVKDTSHLIPGHGGVLDRVDSVLWAGTLTWLFVTLSIS
jgi:phosphatidate cytidylyltransferase